MPSVLVTGGAGYIGSHVCKRLRLGGFDPVALDNLSTGDARNVKWGPLVKGDIRDAALLQLIKWRHRIIGVVHTAALIDVAESVHQPERYREVNVFGTMVLNSVFADHPMVFSSSAAVYGSVAEVVSEDNEMSPQSPYGETKAECEWLLPDAMRLRYFNVSGTDSEIPFRESGTHLIASLLRCANSGGKFELHGDGLAIRDFVDVRDVARANVLALRALLIGIPSCAVNICAGIGYSVRDVIEVAVKVTGRPIAVTSGNRRTGDVDRMVGNNALASLLAWRPVFSLEEQISAAWDSMMGV